MTEISVAVGAPPARSLAADVLVVDDRPLLRAGIRAALRGSPLDVVEAPARHAVELVERHRPGVLVVVLRNGDDDPLRVAAAAKALRTGVSVLVLADDVSAADLRDAVTAGADGVLLTTAALADLDRAIRAVARGDRVVSPEVAVTLVRARRSGPAPPRGTSLSSRELDVLRLASEGLTNQQIAERLGVSPRTVKTHVQNTLVKLEASDRTAAVATALRLRLID